MKAAHINIKEPNTSIEIGDYVRLSAYYNLQNNFDDAVFSEVVYDFLNLKERIFRDNANI